MPKITTFLTFQDRAEEAVKLYASIFPNSRILKTMYYGPGMPMPEGSVMTLEFELDGQRFVALNGGAHFQFSDGISLTVECKDQNEVDHDWEKLRANGGQEVACGWLKDRFGVSWQITPTVLMQLLGDKDPARARRATEAMMKMVKIDIAALKDAAR